LRSRLHVGLIGALEVYAVSRKLEKTAEGISEAVKITRFRGGIIRREVGGTTQRLNDIVNVTELARPLDSKATAKCVSQAGKTNRFVWVAIWNEIDSTMEVYDCALNVTMLAEQLEANSESVP
jgi:hypothetical protein